jgi:hypothetical protein
MIQLTPIQSIIILIILLTYPLYQLYSAYSNKKLQVLCITKLKLFSINKNNKLFWFYVTIYTIFALTLLYSIMIQFK